MSLIDCFGYGYFPVSWWTRGIKVSFFFSGESSKPVDDLEAELEADLDNLKLDDIDTTDVNLDDEELLED